MIRMRILSYRKGSVVLRTRTAAKIIHKKAPSISDGSSCKYDTYEMVDPVCADSNQCQHLAGVRKAA